ncbi:MAG TPA: EAL domain-containing protein [Acidimicrobiia bacterium]|nr:EAL domain-containing protein [Acidimicrobiia bacterium]
MASEPGAQAGGVDGRGEVPATGDAALEHVAACRDLALAFVGMASWEYDSRTDRLTWHGDLDDALGYRPVSDAAGRIPDGADVGRWLLEPVVATVASGAPWQEYSLDRPLTAADGTSHVVLVQARSVASDGVVSCVGVVTDITQHRRTEQALQEHIDRYRLLVELSPDGIVVHQNGVIRWGNMSACRMVGIERPEDAIGDSLLRWLHPDSVPEVMERIAAMREDEDYSQPAEARIMRVGGGEVVVESVSVRTKWEGEPAFQVILRDLTERRRAEASVRYQAGLVQYVSDAIIGVDGDGVVESWNPAAEKTYGWTAEQATGRRLDELVGAPAGFGCTPMEAQETLHRRADGTPVDVRVSVAQVRDVHSVTGSVVVCADITESRRAEAERRVADQRYTAVVEALEEGIIVTDEAGRVAAANPAAERILGDVTLGADFFTVFSGDRLATHTDGKPFSKSDHPAAVTLRSGAPSTGVLMGVAPDGRDRRWLSIHSRPLVAEGETRPYGVVCSFSDVTERRSAESQLNYQATHDALTGLRNRAVFVESLRQALTHTRRSGSTVSVLFIDLDRFKTVNDSMGHLNGDEVLVAIGKRLHAATRNVDTVARLAGDEFVVLCLDLPSPEAAERRAHELAELVQQPISLSSGRQVVITSSIGVSFAQGGAADPEEVLRDADVAMYRAKEKGRARVERFDQALRAQAQRRLDIERDLRIAIEDGQLDVYYQPIASMLSNKVVGVEALVRWNHPTRGPITPGEFIPIAEETGLVIPLGTWVLEQACAQMARWKATVAGAHAMHVSVNLSGRQLGDPELVATIAEALRKSGLDPESLWLEITESVLMDDAAGAARTLAAVRALGVHLVIDDFGTGYSSLAYLKRFPVDMLKIDRSFVDGLGSDPESEAIVHAVVELARSLNLTVVAEGVETTDQLAEIRRLGCTMCQGFLIARPVPADQVSFEIAVPAPLWRPRDVEPAEPEPSGRSKRRHG